MKEMNNLDKQYQALLQDILDNGVAKSDRTGTGTLSVFGRQIRHKMSDGYPLLTTKKMAVKSMVTELMWFLRGDTNIKYLVDNGCNIWNGDAYKAYEYYHTNHPTIHSNRFDILNKEEFIDKIKTDDEFAKKWGELGPIYGKQWRSWKKYNHIETWFPHEIITPDGIMSMDEFEEELENNKDEYVVDQIGNLIEQLKTNPDSRRLMVSAWNVGELDQMVLPPCHYGFQVYTRELSMDERIVEFERLGYTKNIDSLEYVPTRAISLMWNQRSVDTFLGLPFNIASYGLLLEIIAKEVNMVPDELIGNLGDVHLYQNHIEQAKEQITRTPMKLPKLEITSCDIMAGKFEYWIDGYNSHPTIKAPLSN